jgi:hypothetical protein
MPKPPRRRLLSMHVCVDNPRLGLSVLGGTAGCHGQALLRGGHTRQRPRTHTAGFRLERRPTPTAGNYNFRGWYVKEPAIYARRFDKLAARS